MTETGGRVPFEVGTFSTDDLSVALSTNSCGVSPVAVGAQKQIIGLLEQAVTRAACYGARRQER